MKGKTAYDKYKCYGHKKTLTGKRRGGNLSGSEEEKMKNVCENFTL